METLRAALGLPRRGASAGAASLRLPPALPRTLPPRRVHPAVVARRCCAAAASHACALGPGGLLALGARHGGAAAPPRRPAALTRRAPRRARPSRAVLLACVATLLLGALPIAPVAGDAAGRAAHRLRRNAAAAAPYGPEAVPLDPALPFWPQLKDRHAGQECLYIGNGPSLNRLDWSFLDAAKLPVVMGARAGGGGGAAGRRGRATSATSLLMHACAGARCVRRRREQDLPGVRALQHPHQLPGLHQPAHPDARPKPGGASLFRCRRETHRRSAALRVPPHRCLLRRCCCCAAAHHRARVTPARAGQPRRALSQAAPPLRVFRSSRPSIICSNSRTRWTRAS
jgi:hypothetical protein